MDDIVGDDDFDVGVCGELCGDVDGVCDDGDVVVCC